MEHCVPIINKIQKMSLEIIFWVKGEQCLHCLWILLFHNIFERNQIMQRTWEKNANEVFKMSSFEPYTIN